MSAIAISAENLSKCYTLTHERGARGSYRTLRDDLVQLFKKPGNWLRRRSSNELEQFWALNDVSFQVTAGEVVGIVGRNGAGKSTLLKILSRITKPSAGRCVLRGRVGSLLEVGTGFHPELTGRENIFMNGSILGMSRQEIKRNFDAIVDFAEVEKFLDTPVKRYSSGMYVRLAFAVAAHLEPEILIVDEVLAVGDAAFQKKCLGKMQDVSVNRGRTVIFVSHNINALSTLCKNGVLLEKGQVACIDSISTVLQQYTQLIGARTNEVVIHADDSLKILSKSVTSPQAAVTCASDLLVNAVFQNCGSKAFADFQFDCAVKDSNGTIILHMRSKWVHDKIRIDANQIFEFIFRVKTPRLSPGEYSLVLYAQNEKETLLWIEDCGHFRVQPEIDFGKVEMFDNLKSVIIAPYELQVTRGAI